MADTTAFDVKCEILSDVWMEYRDEQGFEQLIEFADLGFPLAYAISNGIVEASQQAEDFVNDTFDLLLTTLKIQDTGFDSITDVFDSAKGETDTK